MEKTQKVVPQKTAIKATSKAKTRFIVTHEYKGDLSMQNAFKEVIENQIIGSFNKWKDEKLN